MTKENIAKLLEFDQKGDPELVSGGGKLFWPNIGFFNGFTSGLNDDPQNPKWENKGGPLFKAAYKCGRIIGGTYFKW